MPRMIMTAPTANPTFAMLLRRYRYDLYLTQEELAELAGLSRRGISDLERGLNRPQRETLVRLLRTLQIPEAEVATFLAAARRVHPH